MKTACVAGLSGPTRTETPPRRLTSAKPSSSVVSSPTNTGTRPRNGCLGHERGDRPSLVVVDRLQLQHHFAVDQPQRGGLLPQQARDRRPNLLLLFGRLAVVHGERPALVLDQNAGQSSLQLAQRRAQPLQGGSRLTILRSVAARHDSARGVTAFGAMHAGRGAVPRAQVAVEIVYPAPADDGQRAAALLRQACQQLREPFRRLHQLGTGRDLQQRAVNDRGTGRDAGRAAAAGSWSSKSLSVRNGCRRPRVCAPHKTARGRAAELCEFPKAANEILSGVDFAAGDHYFVRCGMDRLWWFCRTSSRRFLPKLGPC